MYNPSLVFGVKVVFCDGFSDQKEFHVLEYNLSFDMYGRIFITCWNVQNVCIRAQKGPF